jgi:hypothetical protein
MVTALCADCVAEIEPPELAAVLGPRRYLNTDEDPAPCSVCGVQTRGRMPDPPDEDPPGAA